MQNSSLTTEFEPAGRAPRDVLLRQIAKVTADPLLRSVADGSTGFITVLNSSRQVVFANAAFSDAFGLDWAVQSVCALGRSSDAAASRWAPTAAVP